MSTEGYTEYGYRGLEEIKRLEEKNKQLRDEIEDLKEKLKNEQEQRKAAVR